jgi:hypothetical protein
MDPNGNSGQVASPEPPPVPVQTQVPQTPVMPDLTRVNDNGSYNGSNGHTFHSQMQPFPAQPATPPVVAAPAPINIQDPAQVADNEVSAYQITTQGLKDEDPITAPGGTFYDPYQELNSNQTTVDPWAEDFTKANDPNVVQEANKDIARFDPTPNDSGLSVGDLYGEGVTAPNPVNQSEADNQKVEQITQQLKSTTPISAPNRERVEAFSGQATVEKIQPIEIPTVIDREIENIPEIQPQVEHKEYARIEAPVRDDITGAVLVSAPDHDVPQIEVPITQTAYMGGLKLGIDLSVRWLSELVRYIHMKGYRLVFKSS